MKKQELLSKLSEKSGLSKVDAQKALDALTEVLHEGVQSGEKVSLPQVGHFELKVNKARTGRNPATGEAMEIAESKSVKFKVSKAFKDSLSQ